MSLSNAILHNSAAGTKHTRMHVGLYFFEPSVAQWVVIGQYAMGQSLMDLSIKCLPDAIPENLSDIQVIPHELV